MPAPSSPVQGHCPTDRWIALRCERCEVTWRGLPETPCWTCGRLGSVASNATVVVAD